MSRGLKTHPTKKDAPLKHQGGKKTYDEKRGTLKMPRG
jgi:hypothetical protein